uniref:Secreted peptide n=1 Tax=Arundo donax TaxID=35708 RepID=A0A0A9A3P1_ARUDO
MLLLFVSLGLKSLRSGVPGGFVLWRVDSWYPLLLLIPDGFLQPPLLSSIGGPPALVFHVRRCRLI